MTFSISTKKSTYKEEDNCQRMILKTLKLKNFILIVLSLLRETIAQNQNYQKKIEQWLTNEISKRKLVRGTDRLENTTESVA